jgi:hypothetical protein
MYLWYQNSQVCYAYLADVKRGRNFKEDMSKSNWFTRGWTLQELLAPSLVVFFDRDWIDIGTKGSLQEEISKITGIEDFVNFKTACIAQKMSWVSQRETTRVEDMAYCLLGLFDVNMPPLYGEGEKAFTRLQLEILKISDDESIFAWYGQFHDNFGSLDPPPPWGLLASSPKQFKYSGAIKPLDIDSRSGTVFEGDDYPFTMTNKGLHISLHLFRDIFNDSHFIVPLKCVVIDTRDERKLIPSIVLERRKVRGLERYGRTSNPPAEPVFLLTLFELRQRPLTLEGYSRKYVYVKEEYLQPHQPLKLTIESFTIDTSLLKDHGFVFSKYWHPHHVPGAPRFRIHGTSIEVYLDISCPKTVSVGFLFVNGETEEATILFLLAEEFGTKPGLLLLTLGTDQLLNETTGLSDEGSDDDTIYDIRGFVLRIEWQYLRWLSEGKTPLDRISRHLPGGKSVSASLRQVAAEKSKGVISLSWNGQLIFDGLHRY